jgi:quinol monooxygenase YgiN
VYRDEQAFEAHRENPSIAATLGKVADWKAEPTVQTVCTNISPEDNAWEKLEF